MPLISVIVPVYKVEKYLNRCVDSILSQSFTEFELILIDDGSPDLCGGICDNYATKDRRVCVIHQKNKGLSGARNAGIEWALFNSSSEWITFIDSDDWVTTEYLERLYAAVCQKGTYVGVCEFNKVTDEKNVYTQFKNISEITPENLWLKDRANATVAWGKLYHKSLFENVRYPINKINEDEFTTYKILFQFDKVAFVEEKLYMYFQNEGSIMHSNWTPKRLDIFDAFEEQLRYFHKAGCKKVWLDTARIYIGDMGYALKQLEEKYPQSHYIPLLRKKLRRKIRTYKTKLILPPERKKQLYVIAYPREMKIYSSVIKKYRSIKEIYSEKGVMGVLGRAWEKVKNDRN